MDLTRKFAIAVVMIVPAFVFGGLIWSLLHSWMAVFLTDACVVAVYVMIITGRLSNILRKNSPAH